MNTIRSDEKIYIIFDKRRKWIRKVQTGKDFHSDKGYLHYDDIIGKTYGQTFELVPHKKKVAILKPLLSDIIFQMTRESQIIYPEDLGTILIHSSISSNAQIIEAGTGSGTVTGIMAYFCQPNGCVHSFDIRSLALNQAKTNVEEMHIQQNTDLKLGNILEENFSFQNINFIMLDLATPWLAVPKVLPYLDSTNGRMCLFSPTLEQVKKNHQALETHMVPHFYTLEVLARTFQVKIDVNATRPLGRMIGHTGYMTFASMSPFNFTQKGYTAFYSPENIGNLLIYGQIIPNTKGIILTTSQSPLKKIIDEIMPQSSGLEFKIFDPANLNNPEIMHSFFEDILKQAQEIQYEMILLDNVYNSRLISQLSEFLIDGGIFCGFHHYMEDMKEVHLDMKKAHFYDVHSFELLKRKIIFQDDYDHTSSEILPNEGYLSFGRKVKDNVIFKQGKPKNEEFVEMVLDTGKDL